MTRTLNPAAFAAGGPVVYWMQRAQRGWNNLALSVALGEANARRVPLQVLFVLDASCPDAKKCI